MTKKRMRELADFFYSSNSSRDVPVRIALSSGRYSGFNLENNEFIELLEILNNSKDLKNDLLVFRNKYGE